MIQSNYHTHSKYCDGFGELEDYVVSAIEKGMKYLGFSSHAYLPFETKWAMKKENFEEYKNTVLNLKEKYKNQLEIFLGMEVDYLPGVISVASEEIRKMNLDYTIGSMHFLGQLNDSTHWTADAKLSTFEEGLSTTFKNNIRDAVEKYYKLLSEMVQKSPPDIIGHLDIIKKNNKNSSFFSEDEYWYKESVMETLKVIAKSKCILEVNTGGVVRKKCDSIYPSEWILKECLKLNIPIIVGSDAHNPQDINGYFNETANILKNIGFEKYLRLTKDKWEEVCLK
jgi:histidinol-phosphatase (PHP family)